MDWYLGISIATVFGLLLLLEIERLKRKRLETVVAKLRDEKKLNEQEIVLYMEAQKFDWLGRKLANT